MQSLFNWFSLIDLGRGGKFDLVFFFHSLCSSLKIVEEASFCQELALGC